MAKNKKKRSNGYFFPTPLAVVLLLLAVFALCNLCLKARTEALGREIKALEVQRNALRERLRKEESEWSLIRSPARVEEALRTHGLVMTWPRREQIVRLPCPRTLTPARTEALTAPPRYVTGPKVVMND